MTIISGVSSVQQTVSSSVDLTVTQSGALVVANTDAVTGDGSPDIFILGSLAVTGSITGSHAIDINNSSTSFVEVYVGQAGSVLSVDDAISIESSTTLINDGSITSVLREAIFLTHDDGASILSIINNGIISAGRAGILLVAGDGTSTSLLSQGIEIINTGRISAVGIAIDNLSNTEFVSAHITNSGEIIAGSGLSYDGAPGDETIINSGLMSGGINFAAGTDIYKGAAGQVIGLVQGGDGDDILRGGEFDEQFNGDGGDDILKGGAGDDTLNGGADNDTLRGHKGDDVLNGGGGDDVLGGGDGDDELTGSGGKDDLKGRAGADELHGGANKDTIRGGDGDDILTGGGGGDTLNGGRADDTLTGNGGSDIFEFNRNAGDDRITDFEDGSDLIDLTAFGIKPSEYTTFVAPALSNAGGGDTVLDLDAIGGQGSILIEGLAFADADVSDFIL